jgi:hypothetical protein
MTSSVKGENTRSLGGLGMTMMGSFLCIGLRCKKAEQPGPSEASG